MSFEHLILVNIVIIATAIFLGIVLRRHFAKTLIKTHDHLNFALQSGNMGTWEIDLKTKQVTCSPEMLSLWGISSEDFSLSRNILQSKVHPEDLIRMRAAIDFAIDNDTVYQLKYRIFPTPGVERWVLSRGRCLFEGASKTPVKFAGVVYDITESRHKEQELERALKVREQFLAIAGHELKTPLTCMMLQLQVNEWDLEHDKLTEYTPDKIRTHFKRFRQNLNRITKIVDNILDETKITEGRLTLQKERINLKTMTAELIEQMKVVAEEADTKLVFTAKDDIYGNWDAFKIEQVLLNLLFNAIRYGNKKPVHIDIGQNESYAFISIKDHGIGIKEEDHKKIFERFERVADDPKISGMGLGLYIVNSIVKAHKGEILLKSELGKGSEFTVILPIDLNLTLSSSELHSDSP